MDPDENAIGRTASLKDTFNIAPTNLPNPPTLPRGVLAKYQKIAKLQDEFLILQTSLKTERDMAASILQRVLDARGEVSSLPRANGRLKRSAAARKHWKQAQDRLIEDERQHQHQMTLVSDMEQDLGKLEYKIAKMLPEFLQMFQQQSDFDHKASARQSSQASDQSQRTSSGLDPLELEYYDKRGTIRRLHDELADLEAEFQTPSHEAAAALVPSIPPAHESSLPNFQGDANRSQWALHRNSLLSELDRAEKDLTRLWHECQAAELDVGRLSIELSGPFEILDHSSGYSPHHGTAIDISAPPFLPQNSNGLVPRFLQGLRWPQRGVTASPLIAELTKLADKKHDIERWMSKLPTGTIAGAAPNYSDLVEFEHSVSVTKSDPDWSIIHKPAIEEGFVLIREMNESAPNGEPVEHSSLDKIGVYRKVLRKWKSLDQLQQRFREGYREMHRGSEDIRALPRSPGPAG